MFRDYVVDDFNGDEIFCWKDVSLEMMRAFRRSVGVAYHERVAVFGREPSESLKAAKPSGKTSMSKKKTKKNVHRGKRPPDALTEDNVFFSVDHKP